tara:strand:+ start:776 stop:979 length:204 start_codon:yes stop_codon:yes gene_type:complete
MDKFFEKLLIRIADFHDRQLEWKASLEESEAMNDEALLETISMDGKQRLDFMFTEFLFCNKDNLPQA